MKSFKIQVNFKIICLYTFVQEKHTFTEYQNWIEVPTLINLIFATKYYQNFWVLCEFRQMGRRNQQNVTAAAKEFNSLCPTLTSPL